MNLEREVKLDASEDLEIPDLEGVLDATDAIVREPQDLFTVYVDSTDLRLTRWGCSLRHRSPQTWTVKLPPLSGDEVLVRPEHPFPGELDDIPEAALDLVAAFSRGAPLSPVARLATTRRTVRLVDDQGRQLGEVVDDRVRVESPEGRPSFRQIEVEVAEAAPNGLLGTVLRILEEAGARPAGNAQKYRLALGEEKLAGPEVPAPRLRSTSSIAEVVEAAVAASVKRLILNDPGVRLGEDPEAIHQARVATRRLRSDIRTFRGALDASHARWFLDELAWLGGLLGAVRDADVMLDRLRDAVEALPQEDEKAAAELLTRLEDARTERRRELLEAMRDTRYLTLLDRLVAAAPSPPVNEAAQAPAADALPALMKNRWRKLNAAVSGLGGEPSDEALHACRIQAKRARYAAEAMAPVFGKSARGFARAAAALQDVLGEHHDAVAMEAWLREASHKGGSRQAFVAGQLTAAQRRAAKVARASWVSAWNALDRKRFRFWA